MHVVANEAVVVKLPSPTNHRNEAGVKSLCDPTVCSYSVTLLAEGDSEPDSGSRRGRMVLLDLPLVRHEFPVDISSPQVASTEKVRGASP